MPNLRLRKQFFQRIRCLIDFTNVLACSSLFKRAPHFLNIAFMLQARIASVLLANVFEVRATICLKRIVKFSAAFCNEIALVTVAFALQNNTHFTSKCFLPTLSPEHYWGRCVIWDGAAKPCGTTAPLRLWVAEPTKSANHK